MQLSSIIAPCGLNCEQCFSFESGKIKHHSRELKKRLGNFEPYAKRFETLLEEPIFKQYSAFASFLDFLSGKGCLGCRVDECSFKGCGVKTCFQEKGVDYCFECSDFPCDHSNFDQSLKERWIANNQKMKELGVEGYYKTIKDRMRYQ